MTIDQRLTFITLGVDNLDKMKNFYKENFSWSTLKDTDGIVFFKLNGIILGLFPKDELAADIGIKEDGKGFKNFTMAICLRSEQEVDKTFEDLKNKKVKILKEPEKVFWGGYSGYISDIENNIWEIAFNPFLELNKNGDVLGHP
jgi:predicted enzyme related to lactoylglutathione lyase